MATRKDERLSDKVRQFKSLYDKRCGEYKDKNITSLIWKKIGKELNLKSVIEFIISL